MNKKQLIAQVQRNMGPGATRNTASAAVEAVLASIMLASEQADKLHIARFGTFSRKTRAARRGFDINTGTMRDIPAGSELTFTPAKGFLPEYHSGNLS